MSKGVKKIVSVVAAVAIPFVAPAIATSIGLSSAIGSAIGSATAGSVVGSALTGAALGAAKGAILGEDIRRSALFGGIGGGIGGYMAAPSTVGGGAAGSPGSVDYSLTAGARPPSLGLTTSTTPSLGLAAPDAGTGFAGAVDSSFSLAAPSAIDSGVASSFGPVDYSLAAGAKLPTVGMQVPDSGFFSTGVSNALMTGTPVDYSLTAYTSPSLGLQTTATSPFTGGTQAVTGSGTYQTAASVAATPKPTTFAEALKQVPTEIAAKFSDPKALADLTLRAAGQLVGSAYAGTGLSPEEQRLLDAQTEELRMLQQTNRELFNQRLAAAQQLIGESRYFNPEYFGLQGARRVQVAGARAKRAGLRGLEGPARQAEARRFDLAIARDMGTAFDVGYGTGVQGRLQTIGAGLNAMPQGFPSSMGDYANLRATYADAAGRARERQEDIGRLFGSLTGRQDEQQQQGRR